MTHKQAQLVREAHNQVKHVKGLSLSITFGNDGDAQESNIFVHGNDLGNPRGCLHFKTLDELIKYFKAIK